MLQEYILHCRLFYIEILDTPITLQKLQHIEDVREFKRLFQHLETTLIIIMVYFDVGYSSTLIQNWLQKGQQFFNASLIR